MINAHSSSFLSLVYFQGDFKCVLKKGNIDKAVLEAVGYTLLVQNLTDTPEGQKILSLSGSKLYAAANEEIGDFFEKYRHSGATCDFGGVAMLIEENRTLSDDDSVGLDDDEYFGYVVYRGPSPWILGLVGFFVASIGALIGFVLAMRYNPGFNRRVRSTALFQPLSQNKLVRSTCNLPELNMQNYEEIKNIYENEEQANSHPSF